jgi:hypothetical protein
LILAAAGGGVWWWQAKLERDALAAWNAVPREDANALRAYIADEKARHRTEAQTTLAQLEQTRLQQAQQADSVAALNAFLRDFPQNANAPSMRQRISELRALAQFQASSPIPIQPANGIVFNHFPRATMLQWHPMPQAASYIVEVQMFNPFNGRWVEEPQSVLTATVYETSYSFNFVGAQPGRWRVRAVNGEGFESQTSQWQEFRYTR